jgi:EpsI family protein
MKPSRVLLVIALLLAAAGINYYLSAPDVSFPRKNLDEFPTRLGDWEMVAEHKIGPGSMQVLQVDDYLMRTYSSPKGDMIGIYIGYFKSQREGKNIHSPRQCLPGAGWVPVNTTVYALSLEDPGHTKVPVNRFVMGKGLEQQLYLFWYHGRGRIYASEYWNKLYLIWDSLTKKRTDGALIRLNNPIRKDSDEALKAQMEFAKLMLPLLDGYIPK